MSTRNAEGQPRRSWRNGARGTVRGVADADDGPLGEARKFYRPREKLRWPVVVAPLLPGGEPAGSTLATTRGISVGGAFIESDGVFAVGTALHLWLHPTAPPG